MMRDNPPPPETMELMRQALALPPEARAAFVQGACQDPEKAEELLRRMGELDDQTNSLDVSATDGPADGLETTQAMHSASTAKQGGPADPPALPGYEVSQRLGRGGMGDVYQARHIETGRVVALKVIRQDRFAHLPESDRAAAIDRFRNEAQATARLEHEGIVTVYEVGNASGLHYYAMRYVDGESLADKVKEGPLPSRTAAEYLESASRALQLAHESGVLHRDLKPHNILVDRKTNRALIADFGLAKLREGGHGSATLSGEVFGSPPYMSPEQAIDASSVTEASDIYGLGATLYHVLTGRPPFQGVSPPQTLKLVLEQDPVAPREFDEGIDRELETICLKCLDKERVRRYRTAEELADDLRRYLNDEPIQARPAGRWERARKFAKRNPGLVGGTSAAVVALLVGFIAAAIGMATARREAEAARKATELANDAKGIVENRQRELSKAVDNLNKEKEQRVRAVIASLERTGDLAAQRGRWQVALEAYNQALAEMPVDPIPFKIKRVQALIAVMDFETARTEAQQVLADPGAERHKGQVLMMMAEAAATKFDSDKGREYYRQALDSGLLDKGDAFYAEAVLTEDLAKATELAEAAIAEEPFRQDAHHFLVLLYALGGERAKLLDHVHALQRMFPEDPNYAFFEAILTLFDQDRDAAIATLRSAGTQFTDQQLAAAQKDIVSMSKMLDLLTGVAEGKSGAATIAAAMSEANRLTGLLARQSTPDRILPLGGLTSYPVMQPLLKNTPTIALKLVTLQRTSARKDLAQLNARYRLHELHLIDAQAAYAMSMSYLQQGSEMELVCMKEAEKSYHAATKLPPLIGRLPPVARYELLASHMNLIYYEDRVEGKEREEMMQRAQVNDRAIRDMLLDPNHRWRGWLLERIEQVCIGMIATKDYDNARAVVSDWVRREPDNAKPINMLAIIEHEAGNAFTALELAKKSRKLNPDLKRANKIIEDSIKKLQGAIEGPPDATSDKATNSPATEKNAPDDESKENESEASEEKDPRP